MASFDLLLQNGHRFLNQIANITSHINWNLFIREVYCRFQQRGRMNEIGAPEGNPFTHFPGHDAHRLLALGFCFGLDQVGQGFDLR